MREVGSHSKPAAHTGQSRNNAPVRIGRRAGQVVFWIIALYVGVLGSHSVIAQVFELEDMPEEVDPSCVAQLDALKRALLDHASRVITDQGDTQRDGYADWDERYRRFSSSCEALGPTRLQLRALRQRTETWLARYRREQLPLVQRIDERVRDLGARHHPSPREY